MAFLSLAAISAAAGAANFLLTEDPRRLPALAEEERRLLPLASSSGSSSKAAAAARHAGAVAGVPAGVLTLEAELEMESAPLRHRTSSRTAAAAVTGSGSSSSSLLPLPATPSPAPPRHMAQEDSAHDSTLQLPAPSAKQQLSGLAGEVAAVLRIPTFRLIVAQVTLVWQLWVPCCRRSFCQLLWSAHAACAA